MPHTRNLVRTTARFSTRWARNSTEAIALSVSNFEFLVCAPVDLCVVFVSKDLRYEPNDPSSPWTPSAARFADADREKAISSQ